MLALSFYMQAIVTVASDRVPCEAAAAAAARSNARAMANRWLVGMRTAAAPDQASGMYVRMWFGMLNRNEQPFWVRAHRWDTSTSQSAAQILVKYTLYSFNV